MSFAALLKKPSAFLPVLMSLAALAVVVLHVIFVGTAPQADEGRDARIFQLLLVAELPIVAYFAFRWLPRFPKAALAVLAVQACAGLVALAAVLISEGLAR